MKIWNWLKGLFKAREPTNQYYYSAAPFLLGRKSISGKYVNEINALQVAAVYACVRIISEAIASLPLHVYEYKDTDKERATQHRLYYLLHDSPNPEMTSFSFKEIIVIHLLLFGNSYTLIKWDESGYVTGLYPLNPKRIQVERNNNGQIEYVYTSEAGENEYMPRSEQHRYTRREILHIPAMGFDGIQGYSPIAMARNAIGVAMACEEFGAKFFENDARPSGILKHPGIIKNPQKLKESWQAAYSGANHGQTAVLEEGVEFETISIPPDDAQFLDTRKFQIAEIARIFRVPLHLLNELDRATFSNITQQSLEFVTYTLTPWLVRLEQNFNKALFNHMDRGRYFTKFSVEGFLRGDYETRMRGYTSALQSGILSVNEVRGLEDLNAISDKEGGNLHLVNGNLARLRDAGAAYTQKNGGEVSE